MDVPVLPATIMHSILQHGDLRTIEHRWFIHVIPNIKVRSWTLKIQAPSMYRKKMMKKRNTVRKKASRNPEPCIFQKPPRSSSPHEMYKPPKKQWYWVQRLSHDKKVGKTEGMNSLSYLIIVKAEHISPPGPHPWISEVRVTSWAWERKTATVKPQRGKNKA